MDTSGQDSSRHGVCTTVELRIHGVGPQTPAGVLGVETTDDLEDLFEHPVTTPGASSTPRLDKGRVWQRRSETSAQHLWPRETQAFMWDGLTSSSRFQAFWPILLPFTLLNVAGWMHPRANGSTARADWTRRLILALGLTMSATWGLWIAIFVGYGGHLTPPDVPWWVFVAVPVLLVVAVVIVVLVLQLGKVVVDDELSDPSATTPPPARSFHDRARSIVNVVVAIVAIGAADVGLAWAAGDDLGVLWWRIALVTAGLVVAGSVVAIALRTRLDFEDYVPTRLAEQQSAVPIGIDRVHVESLADDQFFSKEANRKANPAIHIAALLGAVALGILGARRGTVDWHLGAVGQVQGTAASLAFLAVGAIQFVLLGLLYLVSIKPDVEPANLRFRWAGPATTAGLAILLGNGVFAGFALFVQQHVAAVPAGPEVALIDAPMAGVILLALLAIGLVLAALAKKPKGDAGTAIAVAHIPRNLDVVLSISIAITLVVGAVLVTVRFHDGSLDTVSDNPLSKAAQYLFPLAALAALGFVRKALTAQSARRQVGLAWDVLSFWPRRFHPFAVRPYSEKIVPQFQDHLESTLAATDGVVISAHSQGSVIAYAALRGLETTPVPIGRVALVTYGSPLLRLFARMFPHYVRRDDFDAMASSNPAERRLLAWNNYFHATDPIGQDVFTALDERAPEAPRDPRDHLLPDPVTVVPVPDPTEPPGDQTRAPHDGLAIHSQYRREALVKQRILTDRLDLCSTRPTTPATREEPPMDPISLSPELQRRVEALLQAKQANVHNLPPESTPTKTEGAVQIAPETATIDQVLEAAVNLLEVHWVRDENEMPDIAGYQFQKLYSDTPADPLLRQRTAKDFDLSEGFVFTGVRFTGDPAPPTWVVAQRPERTDFASIPGFLTWLIPRYGRHTMAALIHDHLQDLLTESADDAPMREGQQTVTSTQADYIMREAMRSSGVPFAQRWIVWTGISVRTLVTKPLNLWYGLVAALFIIGYGLGVGVVGLGWLLTLPIVHLSGGQPWTPSPLVIAGVLVSPLVLAVLWLPRWRTGVIAAYTVMLVAMPVVAITVARCIYWFVELLGKVRSKRTIQVDGTTVKLAHNPISESRWLAQRADRAET